MAYTKQTWTDDVSAVTGARMTHIEQGIYDNSLATDKINPSGTATTTAEIEEGQINDVIGFKSLKLKGQTSQYTTTGKNLLAIKQLTTQTINGVTFTPHYNGNKLDYVNVNGTATATAGYFLDNASIDQASTYTNELPSGTYILDDFSGSSSVNIAIFFRYSTDNSTLTTINSVENSRKITIDSTFKFASYIRIASGATVNNMKFYPQLETGSTQTTYEPYTNGVSPNPDYPQDVNNVSGYNVIGISNKNLLKLKNDSKVESGTTIKISDTGTIELSGTSSAGINYIQIPENFYLGAGTYIIKTNVTGTSTKPQAFVLYNGSTVLCNVTYNVGGNNATFTLSERTQITKISFWVTSGTVNTNFKAQIQLEKRKYGYKLCCTSR